LALELWRSGIHEARILATIVDDPAAVTDRQLEDWAADFDSWDVVDQCALNLIRKTDLAVNKAVQWSGRPEEFVKRAGFAVMAGMAVGAKDAPDELFVGWLDIIEDRAGDERNFVKKSVNWALRQIGKRNPNLNARARSTSLGGLRNPRHELRAGWEPTRSAS
ncbi:MAG: DNA alkylation repair protein, partial [Actinomycetota bacterium]